MPQSTEAAVLPLAALTLRVLIGLNWLLAIAILALLLFFPNERWITSSLSLVPGSAAARSIVIGLQAIAVVGIVSAPFNHLVLSRLLALVESVGAGDPFMASNVSRLRTIAWALLALQLLGIAVAAIARAISSAERPIDMDAGFSLSGWLAVLLAFVLAQVFAHGTDIRDDLAGTI